MGARISRSGLRVLFLFWGFVLTGFLLGLLGGWTVL
jgi:hypothetical protein